MKKEALPSHPSDPTNSWRDENDVLRCAHYTAQGTCDGLLTPQGDCPNALNHQEA